MYSLLEIQDFFVDFTPNVLLIIKLKPFLGSHLSFWLNLLAHVLGFLPEIFLKRVVHLLSNFIVLWRYIHFRAPFPCKDNVVLNKSNSITTMHSSIIACLCTVETACWTTLSCLVWKVTSYYNAWQSSMASCIMYYVVIWMG